MEEPAGQPSEELVSGKYRLVRLLGRGGMGAVWEAIHCTLGTRVAVKFIEREWVESQEARTRFDNEARAAARLQSRHVVGVYDHGLMPDGRPFIVMEYLDGESLDERLTHRSTLTLAETALIIAQVARGLTKAHQQGIVHRDLKPENIFLTRSPDDEQEIVKVVDFGIAKFTNAAPGVSSATRTGTILGTPFYMSPEQARGLKAINAQSDLWSLGVVVYRCVLGVMPFDGEAVGDLLVKICTQDPLLPTERNAALPSSFDGWMRKALAREPSERFQSALEMASALLLVAGVSLTPMPGSSLGLRDSGAASAATVLHAAQGTTGSPLQLDSSSQAIGKRPSARLGLWLGAGALLLASMVLIAWRLLAPASAEPIAPASGEAISLGALSAASTSASAPLPTASQAAGQSPAFGDAGAEPDAPSAASSVRTRPTGKPGPKASAAAPSKTVDLGY